MSLSRTGAKAVFAFADMFYRRPPGPRILIYHQVGAGFGRQMEVTEDNFRRQLDWLGANRRLVDLETALERWTDRRSDELVALTFDDGHRDVFTTAFPILNERALPFTLYITTRWIEQQEPLHTASETKPLTWDHIREMLDSGLMTVGAHTHTHADLRRLNANLIERELNVSDSIIKSRLGLRPMHFAYPWGYWSELADGQVRRRYESAVVGGSIPSLTAPEWHQLHRYPVQHADKFFFFKKRIRGGLQLEERIRRVLSGYTGP